LNSELILARKRGREAAEGMFERVASTLSEPARTAFCQHMTKLCSEAWIMPTAKAKAFERTNCRVPGLTKFKISQLPIEDIANLADITCELQAYLRSEPGQARLPDGDILDDLQQIDEDAPKDD
jgi:hypothetical protein